MPTHVHQREVAFSVPHGFVRNQHARDYAELAQLVRLWLGRGATDAYVSLGRYLHPTAKTYEDKREIAHDFVLDVDSHSPVSALQDTLKLLHTILDEESADNVRVVYSGAKGFHIYLFGHWEALERDERAAYARSFARRAGVVSVDLDVTTTPNRLIRLVGTPNSKTGQLCEDVTEFVLSLMHGNSESFRANRNPMGFSER